MSWFLLGLRIDSLTFALVGGSLAALAFPGWPDDRRRRRDQFAATLTTHFFSDSASKIIVLLQSIHYHIFRIGKHLSKAHRLGRLHRLESKLCHYYRILDKPANVGPTACRGFAQRD